MLAALEMLFDDLLIVEWLNEWSETSKFNQAVLSFVGSSTMLELEKSQI